MGSAGSIDSKKYYVPATKPTDIGKESILSVKGLFIGVGLFLLLAASIFSSSYFTRTIVDEGVTAVEMVFPDAIKRPAENISDNVENTPVQENKDRAESLIPFSADFAAVFYSPSDFLDALEFLGIENTMTLDFLKNSNRPPYLIILEPAIEEEGVNRTSMVFFASENIGDDYHDKYIFGDYKSENNGNTVVVSNSEPLLKEIIQISKGLKKGLTLNSYYMNVKNKIPERVRSEIFVLTDNGVGYVNGLDIESMPETFKSLILNYMGSGSYYGFVKYD